VSSATGTFPIASPLWTRELSAAGARYIHLFVPMSVILSDAVELDGKRWRHFSMARADRIPTWEELVAMKELFLGAESRALQVIAPRSEWVNIHPYCLHLFVCLDGAVTPDFTHGRGTL
jgi:hypothetical protein